MKCTVYCHKHCDGSGHDKDYPVWRKVFKSRLVLKVTFLTNTIITGKLISNAKSLCTVVGSERIASPTLHLHVHVCTMCWSTST